MPRFDRRRSVMAPRHTVVVRGPPSFADRSHISAGVAVPNEMEALSDLTLTVPGSPTDVD
jgi:hypothetical protein